ncbi:hypothetical protein DSLASN_34710 [Desulfoluna limicola]|uniref:Uncharacterized protein n=1 Tax=Desulfoluna limicola TaxID=2810562 RepID=A0ABM7PJU6_9BACT|nr:hypothetical protein DSLASN_34710 [Desulfoluna limicola]
MPGFQVLVPSAEGLRRARFTALKARILFIAFGAILLGLAGPGVLRFVNAVLVQGAVFSGGGSVFRIKGAGLGELELDIR